MEIKIQLDDQLLTSLRRRSRQLFVGAGVVALSGAAMVAWAVSKPYSFTDGAVISASQVNSNFDTIYNEANTLGDVTNIRDIINKAAANTYCPSGFVAIHTPYSYRGKTGNQICAADGRAKVTCGAVKYMFITNGSGYGSYPTNDLACSSAVSYPWPWGNNYDVPNTLDSEWGHGDTYIVCCK